MHIERNKTYFLSGATGTEIQRRGFKTTLPLWSAQILFDRPDVLTDIHRDYIRAGADIVTTNTFRTQRRTLAKAGLESEWKRVNHLAVQCAVRARDLEKADRPVYIAGCITTLEDCYHPELAQSTDEARTEHEEQIGLLADSGVDFLLLETFNTVSEAEIAAAAAAKTGKPFAVGFTTRSDGIILDGSTWDEAFKRLLPHKPFAILVNCVPPKVATRALKQIAPLAKSTDTMFGAYANGVGEAGSDEGWDFATAGSPVDAYCEETKKWQKAGAHLIGGCCGTSPEYTKHYCRI